MGQHTVPPKPLAHGHVIQVFGLPNMRTVLHCLPPEDWTEPGFMGLGMIYTAMPVTNAVPYVVAAKPGIVTLADLPPDHRPDPGCSHSAPEIAFTASTSRGSSGSTLRAEPATTCPPPSTRNFSKFHVTSPDSPFSLGVLDQRARRSRAGRRR